MKAANAEPGRAARTSPRRRLEAASSLLLALAAAATFACAPAAAQGPDQTCQLAFTRLEPTTTNALLLDTNATYWVVTYNATPGTRLRISGAYPHSRYMSFNVYDPAARPIDALSDVQIAPDAGSTNPFVAGADRTVSKRRYTAFLDFGAAPAHRAPNTMYSGTTSNGSPNVTGQLWYRVYMPDRGLGLDGGVGLPSVTLEPSSGGAASGGSPCQNVALPTFDSIDSAIAQNDGGPLPVLGAYPGRNPPKWTLFVNLQQSFQEITLDNPTAAAAQPIAGRAPASQGAGFYSNKDISYVFAATSRGYGPLIVIHGRAPTFADTRAGAAAMPGGVQVRYFSFCQYDPLSQRVIACVPDDQVARDGAGDYTIVVSTAADRPANATPACGVTWLPWGPTTQGLLIYRHMLPDPSFAQATGRVGQPGREQAVMGDYYPSATYLPSAAAFSARGCPAGGAGGAGVGAGATKRAAAVCRAGRPTARHRPVHRRKAVKHRAARRARAGGAATAAGRRTSRRAHRRRPAVEHAKRSPKCATGPRRARSHPVRRRAAKRRVAHPRDPDHDGDRDRPGQG